MMLHAGVLTMAFLILAGQTASSLRPDPAIACSACDEWNAPRTPFRLFGNTWFVGVGGLSAVLVTSSEGHVLIDGGLPQSAALIDAHIRTLGFRTEDVRLIFNSHAHYDHAGGIAALQRVSGATVVSSPAGARALEAGEPAPDDPQYALGREVNAFPRVSNVRAVEDGAVLRVGDIAVTVHHTPGHTPGGTTTSWTACEAGRCLNVVYADSLTAVSADGFRFSGDDSTPSRVAQFRATIDKVAALPCDIVIAAHPGFTDIDGKLARRAKAERPDPFIDAAGCRAYAEAARTRFEARLAEERRSR